MPEDYALPNFAYPDGHYREHVYDLYSGEALKEIDQGDFIIRLASNANSRDIGLIYDMMRDLVFHNDINYLAYDSSDSGSTGTNSDLGSESEENLTSSEDDEAHRPRAQRNRRRKRRAVRRNRLRLTPGQFHTDMRLHYLQALLLYHRRRSGGGGSEVVPVGFMLFSECFYQGLGGPGLFLDQYAVHPLFHGKHLGTHLHTWLFDWMTRTPPMGEAMVDNSVHGRYYFMKTLLKQKRSFVQRVLASVNLDAAQPSLEVTYYGQLGFLNESDHVSMYELSHWSKIDEMLKSDVGTSAYQLKDILVKEKLLTRNASKFSLKLVSNTDDIAAVQPTTNLSASSLDRLPSDEKEKKRGTLFKAMFGGSSNKVTINASANVGPGGVNSKVTIGGGGAAKGSGSAQPATQPAPMGNRQPKSDSIKCSFVCQQIYYGLTGSGVWLSELQGDLSLLSAPLLRGVIRQSRDKLLQEGGSRLWAVMVEFTGSPKDAFAKQVLKQGLQLKNISKKQCFQLHHINAQTIDEDLNKFGPSFGIGGDARSGAEAVPY